MNDDLVIKYLGIKLKYSAYIKLQIFCVIFLLTSGILFLAFGGKSSNYVIRNAWWICFLGVLCEIGESMWAIKKAKKEMKANS